MKTITQYIKKEAVMIISLLLAIISAFFIKPDNNYISYIDFRTLSLLFCLMAIMQGINRLGILNLLAKRLLSLVKSTASLCAVLSMLCFFTSMIITNDVALITFVPFTIVTLKMSHKKDKMIFIITLETIAANLGSMLTPIGNPQNLYLFSYYNMSIWDFFKTILPYAILSMVMILICCAFGGKDKVDVKSNIERKKIDKKLLVVYAILFIISLLTVLRIINFIVMLIIVTTVIFIFDKNTLKHIDYSLLMTFVFLFIFIGNLGRIPQVSEYLRKIVVNNEVAVGVLSSQILSNVPAAILLSKFTINAKALLIGVNLGGLGTLIASMASLISFKLIQKESIKTTRYLTIFTLTNVVFLALNLILYRII